MTTNQTIDGVPCAHDWTDDGEYLIVCTKCGEQENHDPAWRDMATAPTDGTMVRLLVGFEEHSTEDAEQAPTIGANNFDNDGEDVWRFAGWCWSHDHFTEGKGTPVGWLPMLGDPIVTPAAQPQGEPVAHTMKSVMAAICSIDGFPILTSNQCHALAVKLNAEQPAPVAVVPAGADSISMKGTTIYCNGADNPVSHTMNGLVVNLDGYTLYAPGATPSMCDCNQGRLPCRCKP